MICSAIKWFDLIWRASQMWESYRLQRPIRTVIRPNTSQNWKSSCIRLAILWQSGMSVAVLLGLSERWACAHCLKRMACGSGLKSGAKHWSPGHINTVPFLELRDIGKLLHALILECFDFGICREMQDLIFYSFLDKRFCLNCSNEKNHCNWRNFWRKRVTCNI